jgi:serine/threonine-protein kinase
MVTAAARTMVGSVLSGRWRLVQRLGAGGMGEVYAAEPVPGGAKVAIKLLRPEFLGDPLVLARFGEEGRTCTRLVHPNIVRVLECATPEDGPPYIVMDLLEGVPLAAYTLHGERVPAIQAATILQGVLAGLAAAHAQGVLHCDLKPDNIFLVRQLGGTFVVKILDFGIAKVMDAAGGMGNRTRSGMLIGTPAYLSPEQVRSASNVDERADLWSAGVIFYEMLTGRAAFPAATEYARLMAVLSNEPEPIEWIDPALASLAPFLQRALAKDPDQRFPSALEMGRVLAAATSTETLRPAAPEGALVPPGTLARLPQAPSDFGSPADASAERSALGHTTPARAAKASLTDDARIHGQKPGGTLASPKHPPVVEPTPKVTVAAAGGGTLPSKDLPLLTSGVEQATRGIPRPVVLLLVGLSLAAGVLLGWVLAHLT